MTDTSTEERFLIVKRGLYYRPDAAGFTNVKDEAGRFTESDIAALFRKTDGMEFVKESEASDLSPSWHREVQLRYEREAAIAEVNRLRIKAVIAWSCLFRIIMLLDDGKPEVAREWACETLAEGLGE